MRGMRMRRFTLVLRMRSRRKSRTLEACRCFALHALQLRSSASSRFGVTPAMAAGVTKRLLSIEDIVNLVD